MEEFKTKFMIQLKTPYTHIERAMTLIKINGNDVTFPSATDSANLNTPSRGTVTLTIS